MPTYLCDLCEEEHEVGDPDPHGFGDGGPDAPTDYGSLLLAPFGLIVAPLLLLGITFGLLRDR